ncbi:MAG: hypothetical protein PHG91_07190 [Syntrophales bacterium]|nr:hypothetical protein [Syntrophales bacterium]MDD5532940.1 hypothetical protein [Syntrophales bacterium]
MQGHFDAGRLRLLRLTLFSGLLRLQDLQFNLLIERGLCRGRRDLAGLLLSRLLLCRRSDLLNLIPLVLSRRRWDLFLLLGPGLRRGWCGLRRSLLLRILPGGRGCLLFLRLLPDRRGLGLLCQRRTGGQKDKGRNDKNGRTKKTPQPD